MENSQFVTDAELTNYINGSIQELYDVLVSKSEDYFVTSATITTDGTNKTYNLPSTFYKLLGVDYLLNGISTSMQRFVFHDRNRFYQNARVLRYRIVGSTIRFEPLPAPQDITVWFIPAFTKLVADGDTFDGVNGWEEYVILDSAIKVLNKEESDPSPLMAEKAEALKRIDDLSKIRDQSFPERVTDITTQIVPYVYRFGEE